MKKRDMWMFASLALLLCASTAAASDLTIEAETSPYFCEGVNASALSGSKDGVYVHITVSHNGQPVNWGTPYSRTTQLTVTDRGGSASECPLLISGPYKRPEPGYYMAYVYPYRDASGNYCGFNHASGKWRTGRDLLKIDVNGAVDGSAHWGSAFTTITAETGTLYSCGF